MNILIETNSERDQRLALVQAASELNFWRIEATNLRELWETMIQATMKGDAVTLHHRGGQVRLIPENTALRMSGDIP